MEAHLSSTTTSCTTNAPVHLLPPTLVHALTPERIALLQKLKVALENELLRRKREESRYDWAVHARESQHIPEGDDWQNWLILAGRGFGKTRTGAETVRQLVITKQARYIGLIGQSMVEAASVMVQGESGLLNVFPPEERPIFSPSGQRIFFKNGAVATLFGGNAPERLRGPQFDLVWIDEFAKFKNPDELYNQVMMCLRLGVHPRCIITTTPRPVPLLEKLLKDPKTVVTRGSTFDNAANLAPSYIAQMKSTYAATRIGAQELYAEILSERDGALWNRSLIRYQVPMDENWRRIVIAIDPATTHHDQSDETGTAIPGCFF